MIFESAHEVRWFAVVAAFIVLVMVIAARKRRLFYTCFMTHDVKSLFPGFSKNGFYLQNTFLALALIALVLVLMKPVSGFEEVTLFKSSSEFCILVDVSHSMLAEDIKPSRMERVRYKIRDLLKSLEGDRVALIAFAGNAYTIVPITDDYNTFDLFLGDLSPGLVPTPGTDINAAIQAALDILTRASQSENKYIVMFTDGEDSIGLSADVLDSLKKHKAQISIFGVGTTEGAPIPSDGGGYITDSAGKIVVSRLAEQELSELAVKSGGIYTRLTSTDADLKKLLGSSFAANLKSKVEKREEKKIINRYFVGPLLFAALLFVILESFTTNSEYYWLKWRSK